MSRALRAGHSLTAAIEIIGEESPEPVRSEFREVYRQQNFGIPAREALIQLARRIPLPELNFVVTAILLQKETGGNLVEVLDRTTAVIRERLRIQGEIRIHTAQGRLTGWILSLLPVVMFFLLSLANRGYTRVLIEDPTGRKLIYTGLGSDRAGRTDHPQDCEREDMNGMNAIRVISWMVTVCCAVAVVLVALLMRGSNEAKRLMEVTRAPLSLEPGAGSSAESGNGSAVGTGALHPHPPRLCPG
jgi:hypothetical protein